MRWYSDYYQTLFTGEKITISFRLNRFLMQKYLRGKDYYRRRLYCCMSH